jgi:hypothetical protein
MRAGECRLELERSSQGLDRLVLQLWHAQEPTLQGERATERRPCRRVARIELDGALEQRDRAIDRVASGRAQVQDASRVRLECLD